MSPVQNHRLNPALIQADIDAQVSLSTISDYKPANEAFSMANIRDALTKMKEAREGELIAQGALDTARDAAAAAEWCFHDIMLGAKEQVIAQYGKSSDQLQLLGLKKKSEYKRPGRTAKAE